MEINLPEPLAELTAAFARYEEALVGNDVAALQELFATLPTTIRYGIGENLYGAAEIAAFRAARSPVDLSRTLSRTVITTYGRDFGTASTLFHRASYGTGRPPDAELGPLLGRLARGRGPCERDRAAASLEGLR